MVRRYDPVQPLGLNLPRAWLTRAKAQPHRLSSVLDLHERVPRAMDHHSSGCLPGKKFPTFQVSAVRFTVSPFGEYRNRATLTPKDEAFQSARMEAGLGVWPPGAPPGRTPGVGGVGGGAGKKMIARSRYALICTQTLVELHSVDEMRMRADGAVLKVAKTGSAPEVELVFGDAQWGKYETYLWDCAGHNSTLVRRELNNGCIPDKFAVRLSTAELKGCQFMWEVTIGALRAIGQQYSLKMAFTQDGQPFTAQRFEYSGPLDAVKVLADFVKFRVV
jgi:hypothetical protein